MKKKMNLRNKTILITGSCGFIGYFLSKSLLEEYQDITIVGIDSMVDDFGLKEYRLSKLNSFSNFNFIKENIVNKKMVETIFTKYKPNIVINLAAESSIRDSIENPDNYVDSNIIGFYNILEACRHNKIEHLVYASSSSVYDGNTKVPFSVKNQVDTPFSVYSVTKKTNELFAYCYSKLYNLRTTGLRFFTVYGPLGRPDMAYFKFTNMMINGDKIKLYNYGKNKRNYTYIDDVIESITKIIEKEPKTKPKIKSDMLYAIYNISNPKPESTLDFVTILKEELVKEQMLHKDYDFEIHKELLPPYPGEVEFTYADTSDLERDYGYTPSTSLRKGLREYAKWYKDFYKR